MNLSAFKNGKVGTAGIVVLQVFINVKFFLDSIF
jgi:hypothetical protein